MLLFGRLPLASLIELCRVLRHSLSAGIMLRDVFKRHLKKGSAPLRPIAERISDALEAGDSLEDAMAQERAFPHLFRSLVVVGEKTGNLPEIFAELEKYYITQQRFWRQFRAQSLLPIIQYFAAVFIIASAMWIMGIIAAMNNSPTMSPLGAAFSGGARALRFLLLNFGTIAVVIAAYMVLSRSLTHKARVDRLLLRLPVVGPFLMAFNLARFAMSLRLTLESGMPVNKSVALSLTATGNAAFASSGPAVQEALRGGEHLTTALTKANFFPEDFLHMVAVGEEGGRIPEVMAQQAEQYTEEAERRLVVLSKMLGFLVWLIVACFIIFMIFRLAMVYINALNSNY